MFYDYVYSPAPQPETFQGTKAELAKKLASSGLQVIGGGYGTYVLGGYSSGTIYEYSDKNSKTPLRSVTPDKDLIKLMHDKMRVTEKDYRVITQKLNSGKLSFDELTKPLGWA